MATYLELYGLQSDAQLASRTAMAVAEAARIINAGEDTGAPFSQSAPAPANRRVWAAHASRNTRAMAEAMLSVVLMANKTFTVAQIQGATDAALQTAVNAAVDLFAAVEV